MNLYFLISEHNQNQYLIFCQSTYFEFLIEPYVQQLPKGLLVYSKHHTSFVLYTSDRELLLIFNITGQ